MPAGRPLKFKSAKEIIEKAQAYFDKTPIEQWTITGVALALNTSRETLIDYENQVSPVSDKLSDAVKWVKDMVKHSYELSLRTRGNAGDIFGNKNFGWTDKQEITQDITSNGETIGQFDAEAAAKFAEYLKNESAGS